MLQESSQIKANKTLQFSSSTIIGINIRAHHRHHIIT